MAISAVADPPVAIRMDRLEMMRLRSLHRTSIGEAEAAPFPSSIRPLRRPSLPQVGGAKSHS